MKKLELKTSTTLFIGILLMLTGIFVFSFEYLQSKRDKVFAEMNIKLFKEETPQNVENKEQEEQIKEENNVEEEAPEQTNPTNPGNNTVTTKPTYRYNYKGILEIPKLNLKRGFLDISSKYNNVAYNITVIQGSTFPDEENNNLILAAHSGNCSMCYFDKLYKLKLGDIAYLYYQNIKYQYKIVNIYQVKKTGEVTIYRDSSKSNLTLITCTNGTNDKQSVYILELQSKQTY